MQEEKGWYCHQNVTAALRPPMILGGLILFWGSSTAPWAWSPEAEGSATADDSELLC